MLEFKTLEDRARALAWIEFSSQRMFWKQAVLWVTDENGITLSSPIVGVARAEVSGFRYVNVKLASGHEIDHHEFLAGAQALSLNESPKMDFRPDLGDHRVKELIQEFKERFE